MKRLIEFDALRGILLLMMIVNHSPSALRRLTDQPLGFFTTAECFVFVSAFLAGMLFRKRSEKLGFEVARSSALRRTLRIYWVHVATIAFTFILGSFFLTDLPGIRNLLDHFLLNPWPAILASLALLFRPPLMDILPIYILFSFLTPAAFYASQRWGWKPVLVLSFSTWLIAQTHFREMILEDLKGFSFIQLGPFDLFAWQFLWIGGLFIGQRSLENKPFLPHFLRPLFFLTAIAFLLWRWGSIARGTDPQTWLLDKWHLGPIRLINFAVTASVIAVFLKHLNRWENLLRPVSLIGRHMLTVFGCEICLSVVLLGRTESGLTAEPLTTALVVIQLLTAPLLAWFLEGQRGARQPAPPIPQPSVTRPRVPSAGPGLPQNLNTSRPARPQVLQPLSSTR